MATVSVGLLTSDATTLPSRSADWKLILEDYFPGTLHTFVVTAYQPSQLASLMASEDIMLLHLEGVNSGGTEAYADVSAAFDLGVPVLAVGYSNVGATQFPALLCEGVGFEYQGGAAKNHVVGTLDSTGILAAAGFDPEDPFQLTSSGDAVPIGGELAPDLEVMVETDSNNLPLFAILPKGGEGRGEEIVSNSIIWCGLRNASAMQVDAFNLIDACLNYLYAESQDGGPTPTEPDPPTGLSATADGHDAIDLIWTAPGDDGGEPVTGYMIERESPIGGGFSVIESDYQPHIRFDGTVGQYVREDVSLAMTTATSWRMEVRAEVDWRTAQGFGSLGSTQHGLDVTSSGVLRARLALDDGGGGLALFYGNSTAAVPSGTTKRWVAYEYVAATGTLTFYYSDDDTFDRDEVSWTQLGSPVATGSTESGYADRTYVRWGTTSVGIASMDGRFMAGAFLLDTTLEAHLLATDGEADGSFTSTGGNACTDGGSPVYEPSVTGYTDRGLAAGTEYNYRVSAINAVGTGSASTADSATTDATVPGAPTGLSATADGHNRIDLSWTAPANTGGAAVTGYRIERESPTGNGFSNLVADTGSTDTTYSDTTVAPETEYNYRVSAINSVGVGLPSGADSATTGEAPAPPSGNTPLLQAIGEA